MTTKSSPVAPPPVRSITFFRSGVAAITREGPVDGSFELGVPADAVDDVLGSLAAAGPVTGVTFEPPRNLRSELQSRRLLVEDGKVLTSLIRGKLCGQAVTATLSIGKDVSGRVLGAECGVSVAKGVTNDFLILLEDGTGDVRRLNLFDITRLTPKAPAVRADLDYLLTAVSCNDRTAQLRVQVRASEGASPTVSTGYNVPSPVWRIRYELRLGAEGATLVPWGIVHNPLDEKLTDVTVTLTTGSPVSFRSELNLPATAQRSTVREDFAVAGPNTYDAARPANGGAKAASVTRGMTKGGGRGATVARVASFGGGAEEDEEAGLECVRGYAPEEMETAAEVGSSGGETTYTINGAELPPSGAATLALARFTVKAEALRVWRAGVGRNPEVAVLLVNDTGSTLERGSVAVYGEGGAFVGQALIPYTPPGAEVFAPYARDSALTVTASSSPVSEAVVSQELVSREGQLFVRAVRRPTYLVSVHSSRGEAGALVIERPANPRAGLRYIEQAGVERLAPGPNGDRFKVTVNPGANEFFFTYEAETLAVSNGEMLVSLIDKNALSSATPAQADAYNRVMATGAALKRAVTASAAATRRLRELAQEENGLIGKLSQVKDTAPAVAEKYRSQLELAASGVFEFQEDVKRLNAAREDADTAYEAAVNALAETYTADGAAYPLSGPVA